jgi:hypothetical protein
MTKEDVIQYMWDVRDQKELLDIARIMRKRLSQLKEQAIHSFSPGERVQWEVDKTAEVRTGTVMHLRRTNLAVKADDGRQWLIPATMLTKIGDKNENEL